MFDADLTMPESEWYERFPLYEVDSEIGFKMHWPPASEIWRNQGKPTDSAPCWDYIGPAWAMLQALHESYERSQA
jgi:hypothetical protein